MSTEKIKKMLEIDNDVKSFVYDLTEKIDAEIGEIKQKTDNLSEELKVKKGELNETIRAVENSISEVKTIKGDKGDKGEKGDRGERGKDGKDGKNGIDGKDGADAITPIKGVDYFDGKDGADGKDGSPDTPEQIIEKINSLPVKKEFQIDAKHIKNLPSSQVQYFGRGGGGVETSEVVSIINSTLKFSDDETPTGDVNGANTDFVLAYTPKTGSLKVYVNGSRMRITEDYTLASQTITFITPPPSGSIILCDYRYV